MWGGGCGVHGHSSFSEEPLACCCNLVMGQHHPPPLPASCSWMSRLPMAVCQAAPMGAPCSLFWPPHGQPVGAHPDPGLVPAAAPSATSATAQQPTYLMRLIQPLRVMAKVGG